jgi:hypothetical protein
LARRISMPMKDGRGPRGGDRGMGPAPGAGIGRMGGAKPGSGPSGNCLCQRCGEKVPHTRGVPCSSQACPRCGSALTRE